jgi:flagellar M-ring protein FliF
MLDTVLGPDHAVVRVNDVMDFTQKSYTATDYGTQTATSPITSSHVVDNQTVSPAGTVGGTVGLGSNVPTYGTKASATVPITNTQHLQDISYSPSMTTTTVIDTPGVVQKLSVAVVLDQVQSPAELASIRQAVTAAAGLNPARGDLLSITSVPFDTSAATAAARAQATQQQNALILNIVRWAALLIVPLVLLFLLLRVLAPARRKTTDVEGYSRVRVVEESDLELEAAQPIASLPPGPETVARQTVAEIAREKPEILAGVIARWIDEDRR